MSAVVKLGAALPGDFDVNGLDAQVDYLLENPKDALLALVWLDVKEIKVDTDSGAQIPTVRVRRIEPLGAVGEVSDAVQQLAGEAFESRTGRRPIPFDVVEVTEEKYSDTLPEDE
jgi:hypothetical protein